MNMGGAKYGLPFAYRVALGISKKDNFEKWIEDFVDSSRDFF
jgi:hypothetical protein